MPTLADNVRETSTTAGTGDISLLGQQTGCTTFAATLTSPVDKTTTYRIDEQTGSNWEVGIATYNVGSNTLSRTTVLASSNGGSLVAFGSGVKNVSIVGTAALLNLLANKQSANTVLRGPTSGVAAAPVWGALVPADIPGITLTNQAPVVDFSKSPYALVQANGVGNNDNWALLQGAVDQAIATGFSGYQKWKIPAGVSGTVGSGGQYFTSKPVLCDLSQMVIEGEGPEATGLIGNYGPVFIFGIPRRQFTSGHFVSTNGVLDSSVPNNTRWGLRVYDPAGDHLYMCPSFGGTTMDLGPYIGGVVTRWSGVQQFVIDFAMTPNGTNANWVSSNQPIPIVGMFKFSSNRQQPWYIVWAGTNTSTPPVFTFSYATADGTFNRTVTFPGIANATFLRVSLQVDLLNGVITAWVGTTSSNMQQVTVTGSVPSGAALAPNTVLAPFNIGTLSENNGDYCHNEGFGNGPFDQTFWGLNMTYGLLYNVSTTGSAQTRISGTLNDLNTYFTKQGGNSTCIGLLTLDDDGVANLASQGVSTTRNQPYRLVKTINSYSDYNQGYGILAAGDLAEYGCTNRMILSRMALSAAQRYGSAIIQGSCLHMRYENCLIGGGAISFLIYGFFVNYYTTFTGCVFQSSRVAVFRSAQGNITVRDAYFQSWTQNIYVCVGGYIWMDNWFASYGAQSAVPFDLYGNDSGMGFVIKGGTVDYEGPYPACYIRADADTSCLGYVENFIPGIRGVTGAPDIVLQNTSGTAGSAGSNYTLTVLSCQNAINQPLIVGGRALNNSTPPPTFISVVTAPAVTPGTTVGCVSVI